MHPFEEQHRAFTRRQLFQKTGMGIGGLALSWMMQKEEAQAKALTHFAPKAKSVIYMHFVGGPSHLDLFDHKRAGIFAYLDDECRAPNASDANFVHKMHVAFASKPALYSKPKFGTAAVGVDLQLHSAPLLRRVSVLY